MKVHFYLYDTCVFYEIVLAAYFLKATDHDVFFCGHSGRPVTVMEGFTVRPDMNIRDIPIGEAAALVIPGGITEQADRQALFPIIREFQERGLVIAAICAGVELLKESGILERADSALSSGKDCVRDKNLITAEPNAYVDFALEIGRSLDIFEDEEDFKETVNFFKYFKK